MHQCASKAAPHSAKQGASNQDNDVVNKDKHTRRHMHRCNPWLQYKHGEQNMAQPITMWVQ